MDAKNAAEVSKLIGLLRKLPLNAVQNVYFIVSGVEMVNNRKQLRGGKR